MRYGQPSIEHALDELERERADRILAFPMYPQYSSATTGSSLERLFQLVERRRVVPSIRVVPPYFADPRYIAALAEVTRGALARLSPPPPRLLTSFHGLPARYVAQGDPYADQCRATASLLEQALAMPETPVAVVFQSRFGREEWLKPYTDETLATLGRTGTSVAVMCPGFTADCLETLEEIGLRGAEQFHEAGGGAYLAVPCLNEHPAWLAAMAAIAEDELAGWLGRPVAPTDTRGGRTGT
jgi:ferrochelatase